MDRFTWSDGILTHDEQLVCQQNGVRLYDGNDKTGFDHGQLQLTSHRLIWKDYKSQTSILALPLSSVVLIEEEGGTFTKSPKIVVHLSAPAPDKPAGPVALSQNSFVRLSFKEGGEKDFYRNMQEELGQRRWEIKLPPAAAAQSNKKQQYRTGISGIERSLHQRNQTIDKNISQAFEDLSKLMDKAKEMVAISKSISTKIKDKQGDITDDETQKFRSYLLSLGIDDPVTRETHGTGDAYLRELARQISDFIHQPLQDCGGVMTLTDIYCRINRARGMELLSPDDLVKACKFMEYLKLPVRLRVFESGVMVLQLQSHSEQAIIAEAEEAVQKSDSLTAEELSRLVGLSVVLSRERLLTAERAGKLCRDESMEGLRFYTNLFLTREATYKQL